jgi:peptidoglycan/LPS O-acetylase OafA/YrhL
VTKRLYTSKRIQSHTSLSHLEKNSVKRVPELDGLRGLAIVAVLFTHLGQIFDVGITGNHLVASISRLMGDGWIGVDIFFVLSGFLITSIIRKDRTNPSFWSTFYLRRAFRILPAFFVVFFLTLLAIHFFKPDIPLRATYIWPVIFFLANWTILGPDQPVMLSHLWSLAVEEQFYFVWPQLAKRMSGTALLTLTLVLSVACEILRVFLTARHLDPTVVYALTPTHMDGLTVGAGLAVSMTLPRTHAFLAKWWRRIAILAVVVAAVSFLFANQHSPIFNGQVMRIPPAIVLTAMLIFGSMESALPPILSWFFSTPVMSYLGRRSYALYLINRPIQVAVSDSRNYGYLASWHPGITVNIVLMILVTVISLILTELSWRLIEAPAQNLRHRLKRGR